MQIQILPLGFLKARAVEMIKPLSVAEIGIKYKVDTEGYIKLSLNGLLVMENNQVVIIDPGCADFLPGRVLREYGLEVPEPMESVLEKVGISTGQVTDVIFTHLHFDHGSGAFQKQPGRIVKRFANARYHLLHEHYEYALHPDGSESNSFFTGFFRYVDAIHWLEDWSEPWMEFRIYNGHTKGMVIPVIKGEPEPTYFVSDLLPMQAFLKNQVYSGYDLDPGLARKEKQEFIDGLDGLNKLVFFHDPLIDSMIYP